MQKLVHFEQNTSTRKKMLLCGIPLSIGAFLLLNDPNALALGIPGTLERASSGLTSVLAGMFFLIRTFMSR